MTLAEATLNEVSSDSGLTIKGLRKSYKKRTVIHDVSMQLRRGEVVALLGPNGSGKTTTFYSIAGLVNPDGGQVKVDGVDVSTLPMYRRARLGIGYLPQEVSIFRGLAYEIIQHAFGVKTKVMQDCIPENAQSKVIFNSRIFVAIWIAIILWSLITLSWLPVLFFLLPKFYGRTLHKLVSFTQHAGLARNIKDHRYTTREMYLNPILSFLYWKMEYHVTHHMFPTVPSYNLDKLHHHIKDQLPRTNDGLIDAYKEILPAIMKQSEDTNYFFKKEVPEPQNA